MSVRNCSIVFLWSVIIVSCKKDNSISTTPEIAFVSVSPSVVKEYKDSIVFTISYRDGDGDLGENNADAKNLFLTDNRNGITYQFRISQLAPTGSSVAIKGNLNVVLNNTGITNATSSQTVSYNIYVKDRAGNQSNTITTSAITVSQ